jgi:hypothetical protein
MASMKLKYEHPTEGQQEVSTASVGETIQQAVELFGEEIVYRYYQNGVREAIRHRVAKLKNRGTGARGPGGLSHQEIQTIMNDWTPQTPFDNTQVSYQAQIQELANNPEKAAKIQEEMRQFTED